MALIRLPASFRRHSILPLVFCVCLVLPITAILACSRKPQEGRGLLPAAPAGQATSAVPSLAPFDQTLGTGAFARTVFSTPGPANLEVTVRDVIVAPHAEAQLPSSTGPVIIDTRSGAGTASAGSKIAEISLHQTASFPAGAPLQFKNGGNTPLVLRLYVLEGK